MPRSQAGHPLNTTHDAPRGPHRTTITVLTTQLDALHELLGEELSDDDVYSAAAIAVLLYITRRPPSTRSAVPPVSVGVPARPSE